MTQEEFEKTWVRESGTQPGLFLDVQQLDGLQFVEEQAD